MAFFTFRYPSLWKITYFLYIIEIETKFADHPLRLVARSCGCIQADLQDLFNPTYCSLLSTQMLFNLHKIVPKSTRKDQERGWTKMWCISCNKDVEKVSLSIGNQGMIEVGLIYLLCTYLNFKCEKPLLWDQTTYCQGEYEWPLTSAVSVTVAHGSQPITTAEEAARWCRRIPALAPDAPLRR